MTTETIEAPAVSLVPEQQNYAVADAQAGRLQATQPWQPAPADPVMAMMQVVVARGGSIDELNKLVDLRARLKAEAAEEAFIAAMAEFKKNPPVIVKDNHVEFGTGKGSTSYYHATHFGVTHAIVADLAKVGITHRWDCEQHDGKIAVTCVLTHSAGHSQRTRLEASYDNSGGKNSIQAIVSAKSYLERHTLTAATGLSTKDQPDDDGRGFEPSEADKLLDQFIREAEATKTDADALAVWKARNPALAKWAWAHAELKAAVAAHRTKLQQGAAQ